jgi:hypothetical protein
VPVFDDDDDDGLDVAFFRDVMAFAMLATKGDVAGRHRKVAQRCSQRQDSGILLRDVHKWLERDDDNWVTVTLDVVRIMMDVSTRYAAACASLLQGHQQMLIRGGNAHRASTVCVSNVFGGAECCAHGLRDQVRAA